MEVYGNTLGPVIGREDVLCCSNPSPQLIHNFVKAIDQNNFGNFIRELDDEYIAIRDAKGNIKQEINSLLKFLRGKASEEESKSSGEIEQLLQDYQETLEAYYEIVGPLHKDFEKFSNELGNKFDEYEYFTYGFGQYEEYFSDKGELEEWSCPRKTGPLTR